MADKAPVTNAVRALRAAGIAYTEHRYEYVEHGGTTVAAQSLGLDHHAVVKTLVMQTEAKAPLIALMHGDRMVSTQKLARALGVKRIDPCDPAMAQRHTGYLVGGTSPFGTRKALPVYVERTILDLPRAWVNGGKRGFLVGVDPRPAFALVAATPVDVAVTIE